MTPAEITADIVNLLPYLFAGGVIFLAECVRQLRKERS